LRQYAEVHKPVPPGRANDDWDTINSAQLYRLYPHKPIARNNFNHPLKQRTLSALKRERIRSIHEDWGRSNPLCIRSNSMADHVTNACLDG
jgi:hypothetical protein